MTLRIIDLDDEDSVKIVEEIGLMKRDLPGVANLGTNLVNCSKRRFKPDSESTYRKRNRDTVDEDLVIIETPTISKSNDQLNVINPAKSIKLNFKDLGIILPPQYLVSSTPTQNFNGRLVMTKSLYSDSKFGLKDLIIPNPKRMLLSAMCVDDEWVSRVFPQGIPTIVIRPRPADAEEMNELIVNSKLKFVFPPLKGYGCMHTKLIVLWYEKFVRIAIPSANLLDFDWDTIENSVFYQDFPLAQQSTPSSCWIDSLKSMLSKMGLSNTDLTHFDGFDYSKAVGELVVSIPGSFSTNEYGINRLGHITSKIIKSPPNLITAQVRYC